MRAMWKGVISFGLINIPVSLRTATQDHELKFTLLHKKDLSEIRYARICKHEDKEVPYKEIVKGFEQNGNYIVVTDEDFAKAEPAKSKMIEILGFTDVSEIDSVYFDKPYFLMPEKNGEKAYALLRDALDQVNKVAIVKYIFKNHEHIGAIKSYENALVLNQMRHHDQLLDVNKLEISKVKVSDKELQMAVQLVDQQTVAFKPEQYHDTYIKELEKLIKQKSKGGKIQPKGKEPKVSKVHDIMSLLKASLEENKPKRVPAKRRAKAK